MRFSGHEDALDPFAESARERIQVWRLAQEIRLANLPRDTTLADLCGALARAACAALDITEEELALRLASRRMH